MKIGHPKKGTPLRTIDFHGLSWFQGRVILLQYQVCWLAVPPKKNNGWKKYAKHGTCINKRDIWSPAYKSWKQGNPLPHCCPVLWVEFVLWVEESAVKCMGHPTQTVALVEQIPN